MGRFRSATIRLITSTQYPCTTHRHLQCRLNTILSEIPMCTHAQVLHRHPPPFQRPPPQWPRLLYYQQTLHHIHLSLRSPRLFIRNMEETKTTPVFSPVKSSSPRHTHRRYVLVLSRRSPLSQNVYRNVSFTPHSLLPHIPHNIHVHWNGLQDRPMPTSSYKDQVH